MYSQKLQEVLRIMGIGGKTWQNEELTRPEVAAMLKPKVSARQLQAYLNIARKYLPEFKKFTNKKTGGLNGMSKLYLYHIAPLQEIRSLAREHTLADIENEFHQRGSKK
ncbi:MAG: hypothetical protein RM368_12830 [Nostoc sp. DedSLP03]|uniref:hypothetical protein n=1 Tax=Nostoc sp. DedSLP03 TaxID=3075400 RepID=UPI002AD47631|nr:hypothetical protein [Nostoc sp. DedSLP03]MDZ7965840.1 hypothetical protein [Nostoc sp. DedSLP03]